MKTIDLHVHSYHSDGTCSPKDLALLASTAGLSAYALTDHDSTDGLEEAIAAAAPFGIEVLPGIEFSTEYKGIDVHIVGLEFDHTNSEFREHVTFYRDERLRRNIRMIQKMADGGIDISYEKMTEAFGDRLWTRAHFARYLINHGYAATVEDAFEQYIGERSKFFIPREKVSPYEAVKLLRQYGGIPILAHPFQYQFSDSELRELILWLKEAGLIGMEVYYSIYSPEQMKYLEDLAIEMNLLPSGGSDFHGGNKPHIALGNGQGNLEVPYSIIEAMRQKRALEQKN